MPPRAQVRPSQRRERPTKRGRNIILILFFVCFCQQRRVIGWFYYYKEFFLAIAGQSNISERCRPILKESNLWKRALINSDWWWRCQCDGHVAGSLGDGFWNLFVSTAITACGWKLG